MSFKAVCSTLVQEVVQRCERLETGVQNEDTFLKKSLETCMKVTKDLQTTDTTIQEVQCGILQNIAKALLDYTYDIECKLVNADFAAENAEDEVSYIVDQLYIPEKLATQFSLLVDGQTIKTLSDEIYECLYWRRGAILYMYCFTKYGNDGSTIKDWQKFLQYVVDGCRYLKQLLTCRSPVSSENVQYTDINTFDLLSQGIYSDTHVLALMYGGEMCFWFTNIIKRTGIPDSVKDFNVKEMGKQFLQQYIKIVKGPLKMQQWDSSKAEQILKSWN